MIFHKTPIAFARTPQAPLQARGYAAGLPAYPGAGPAYIISCSNNWQCPGELPLGECQPNSYGWLGCQKCGGVRLWQSLDMWQWTSLDFGQMEIISDGNPMEISEFLSNNWRHLDFPMGFWPCSQRIAPHSSTATARTACNKCNAGYYERDGRCQSCSETWSDGATWDTVTVVQWSF